MRNIRLIVSYDGTDFHGWQIQPGPLTVQGLITDVLGRLTQERVTLYGAGRTDAGVHAWGQVANFKTPSRMTAQQFLHGLNALLPPTVRVRSVDEVSLDFHSRWCAEAKTYRYTIYRGPVIPPFLCRYALHHPYPLDFAAMSAAARCFEGTHDFTTFAASTGSEEEDVDRNVIREIHRSELLAGPAAGPDDEPAAFGPQSVPPLEQWVYLVRGRSFLRHMVRKIVGALLEVGRGRLSPTDIPRLLELRDRTRSGPTAPAQGLCLLSVEYPEEAARSPRAPEEEGMQ